jgi:hypothetical protein
MVEVSLQEWGTPVVPVTLHTCESESEVLFCQINLCKAFVSRVFLKYFF